MPFDFNAGSTPESSNQSSKGSGYSNGIPTSLKLEFSKAADYSRINRLFDPDIKINIDPLGYVVKRVEPAFRKAVNSGAAVVLSDRNNDVQALTIAYHIHDDGNSTGAQHDYTEIGTSLSRLPGYSSAKLIVAALALKEWWRTPPKSSTVAEIKLKNIPSIKTYKDGLGWEKLQDRELGQRIYDASDSTLVNEKDKSANKSDKKKSESYWFHCGPKAVATQARILLEFMSQGGVINKRTQHKIPVDFSVLDKEGLTKPRLEAIAKGETSRKKIQALGGRTP